MEKKILTLLISLTLIILYSCSSDDSKTEGPAKNPEINIDIADVVVVEGETHSSVKFSINVDWTISLTTLLKSNGVPTWLDVSPMRGSAGVHTLDIKIKEENPLYEDRNALIAINVGGLSKNITVTQKRKDAILLSKDKVELDYEGATFPIEVKSNIDYEVIIPEEYQDWLKRKKEPKSTNGLKNTTEWFEVTRTDDGEKREGKVIFKSGNIEEILYIFQTAKEIMTLTDHTLLVTHEGAEAQEVNIRTNIAYKVIIPDNVKWIKQVSPKNKSVRVDKFYLQMEPETTYSSRSATIYVKSLDEKFVEVLTIYQSQQDAILLSPKIQEVSNYGGNITVYADYNVNYNIEIPSGVSWVTEVALKSSGLNRKTHRFKVSANEEAKNRETSIVFRKKDNKTIADALIIKQSAFYALILSERELNLEKNAQTISAELKSNLQYDIIIPDSSKWIKLNKTKSLETYHHRFDISENDTYSKRTGKIIFKDLNSKASDTLTIHQDPDYVILISTKKYELDHNETPITLDINTNIENYEISIPADASWIKEKIPFTKALKNYTHNYIVKENESFLPRETVIKVLDKAKGLSETVEIKQKGKPNHGIYYVEKKGTLEEVVNLIASRDTITYMKIIGEINSTDIAFIKELPNPFSLNLSETRLENNTIPEQAFIGSRLKRITLNETIEKIGDNALAGCDDLIEVTIPSSVKNVGKQLFVHCDKLEKVDFKCVITSVPQAMFFRCIALKEVKFTQPEKITKIENNAFSYCKLLQHMKFGEMTGLSIIEKEAFYGCNSLSGTLILPESLKWLYEEALAYTNFTGKLALPSRMSKIAERGLAFTDFSEIIFPENLVSVSKEMCRNMDNLKTITIPENITTISEGAFLWCVNLEKITFHNKLKYIGNHAFENCNSLKGIIEIPESVDYIGWDSFNDLGIENNEFKGLKLPWFNPQGKIINRMYYLKTLYIPKGSLQNYKDLKGYRFEYEEYTVD